MLLKVSASASPCQVKSRICPALLCREDSQKENELLARNFLKSAKRSHHTHREFCGIPQPTIAPLAQTRTLQGLQRRWKLRQRESAPGTLRGWSRGDLCALQTVFWRRDLNQLEPNVLFFTTAPQHPHVKLYFSSVIIFGSVLLQMWFVPGTSVLPW